MLRQRLKCLAACSALHDRRFPAITADEVPQLSCTVSFLHSFEHAADWSDWTVGTHGLIIKFTGQSTSPLQCPAALLSTNHYSKGRAFLVERSKVIQCWTLHEKSEKNVRACFMCRVVMLHHVTSALAWMCFVFQTS